MKPNYHIFSTTKKNIEVIFIRIPRYSPYYHMTDSYLHKPGNFLIYTHPESNSLQSITVPNGIYRLICTSDNIINPNKEHNDVCHYTKKTINEICSILTDKGYNLTNTVVKPDHRDRKYYHGDHSYITDFSKYKQAQDSTDFFLIYLKTDNTILYNYETF